MEILEAVIVIFACLTFGAMTALILERVTR